MKLWLISLGPLLVPFVLFDSCASDSSGSFSSTLSLFKGTIPHFWNPDLMLLLELSLIRSFSCLTRRGNVCFGIVDCLRPSVFFHFVGICLQAVLSGPKNDTSNGWHRCVELGGRNINEMSIFLAWTYNFQRKVRTEIISYENFLPRKFLKIFQSNRWEPIAEALKVEPARFTAIIPTSFWSTQCPCVVQIYCLIDDVRRQQDSICGCRVHQRCGSLWWIHYLFGVLGASLRNHFLSARIIRDIYFVIINYVARWNIKLSLKLSK